MLNMSSFANMPLPAKAAITVLSGGGLVSAVWLVCTGLPGWFAALILGGIAVIMALLLVYGLILKRISKSKIAPMEKGLMKSSFLKNVQDPTKAAQLDDLKNKFREGIETYKIAGKNIYELPWYMVVGEPGSGKTEAIRHSNIGFPPGLQDLLQGTGGTVNMNWWFSDYAVLLDTAGDMVFENVEAGGTEEWKEFLKLLKKYRSNCPVNGILLVIPADTLIRDGLDVIEKKASKIAMQFDVLQRTLDVRFPVYIVVSKCDLVQGFRDFFDDISDPVMQHQIFGWSNSQPLDTRYNNEAIDSYLNEIKESLNHRRLALLQDEISGKGFGTNRQTEIYYSFPANLGMIGTRLKKYLEMIFVAGSSWSCKPLFFRGIYFTSSMREGAALDMELANFLNVEVSKLPDERIWGRDKAYFLRDLFVKKIFAEKGLVTSATDAKAAYTKRKAALFCASIFVVISMLALTVYSAIAWNRSIGTLKEYLGIASSAFDNSEPMKDMKIIDSGGDPIINSPIKGIGMSRHAYYADLSKKVENLKKNGVPFIFRLISAISNGFTSTDVNIAQEKIYNEGVIIPVLEKAIRQFDNEPIEWDAADPLYSDAFLTMYQLVMIKSGINFDVKDSGFYNAGNFIDPVFKFAFKNDLNHIGIYNEHSENLNRPLSILYCEENECLNWPSNDVRTFCSDEAIEKIVLKFIGYWTNISQSGSESDLELNTFKSFVSDLEEFMKEQERLSAVQYDHKAVVPKYNFQEDDYLRDYAKSYELLSTCYDKLKSSNYFDDQELLQDIWQKKSSEYCQKVNRYFDMIEVRLKESPINDEFVRKLSATFTSSHKDIVESIQDQAFNDRVVSLDTTVWKKYDGIHILKKNYDIYTQIDEFCKKEYAVKSVFDIQRAINNLESDKSSLLEGFKKANMSNESIGQIDKILELMNYVYRVKLCRLITDSIEKMPRQLSEIETCIADKSPETDKVQYVYASIPYSPKYDPSVVSGFSMGWAALKKLADKYPESDIVAGSKKIDSNLEDYYRSYIKYWLTDYPEKIISLRLKRSKDWAEQLDYINKIAFQEELEYVEGCGNEIDGIVIIVPEKLLLESEIYKSFKTDLRRIGLSSFEDGFSKQIQQWKRMPSDVFAARKEILSKDENDLRNLYFRFAEGKPQEFLKQYCNMISYNMIAVLADDFKNRMDDNVRRLQSYLGLFPVSFGSDGQMSEEDAVNFKEVVSQVYAMESQAAVSTGSTKVDSEIEKLKKISGESEQEMRFFYNISQLLPPKGKQYYCRISLAGRSEQQNTKDGTVIDKLNVFKIMQGQRGNPNGFKVGIDDAVVILSDYPGRPLQIYAYRYTTDEKFTASWTGDNSIWGGLWLLKMSGGSETNQGLVDVILPYETQVLKLRLKLEFFRDDKCTDKITLPDRDDWNGGIN